MTTVTQRCSGHRAGTWRRSKPKQQAMWASGDFAVIGTTLQIVGELLCEAVDSASVSACSTSPRATAMRRWPRHAASRA